MITENSLEEKILEMQLKKQKEEKKLLFEKVEKVFPIDLLKNIVEYGKPEVLSETSEDLVKLGNEEGIEKYLGKCEVRTLEMKLKFENGIRQSERFERED